MASARRSGEDGSDTNAELAERRSARQLGHLIIEIIIRRVVFDEVASLSVEGLNKSGIARVKSIAWNTVHRWLERVAACCRRFSPIVGNKDQQIWVFVVIDVSTRLWPSTAIGK